MTVALDLLREPLVTLISASGERVSASLPAILAGLVRNDAVAFPALRPHQRHAWHAFLVQLAGLALDRAGVAEPPTDAEAWTLLLRGLTPEWPQDEPWHLVTPVGVPALLQPPLPTGTESDLRSVFTTPDELDCLVTSRNHDLKAAVMERAAPEHWLFALVSLQTMEGFMGQGNYGISRMNGGFSSRPCVSIVPPGGLGARFRRDVRLILRHRRKRPHHDADLHALLWLLPWDGTESLDVESLDPLYIEVCRRVRLQELDGRIQARGAGSKVARIAAQQLKGNTGDPWTPVQRAEGKALSITGGGFGYRQLVSVLDPGIFTPGLLQRIAEDDPAEGLTLFACGLARGQGKTEGYHERAVPIPREVRDPMADRPDLVAILAKERVDDAGKVQGRVLRPALFVLLQQGQGDIDYQSKSSGRAAERWLRRLDGRIDDSFFSALWAEVAAPEEERERVRIDWIRSLADEARQILEEAIDEAPQSAMRRYRARAAAYTAFEGRLRAMFPELKEVHRDDAAA